VSNLRPCLLFRTGNGLADEHFFSAEKENSIAAKLKRGSFHVTFFPAYLVALELDGVALEEI